MHQNFLKFPPPPTKQQKKKKNKKKKKRKIPPRKGFSEKDPPNSILEGHEDVDPNDNQHQNGHNKAEYHGTSNIHTEVFNERNGLGCKERKRIILSDSFISVKEERKQRRQKWVFNER